MAEPTIIKDSVRVVPTLSEAQGSNLIVYMAQANSIIEPWAGNPYRRDQQLSKIWKEEPFLKSAVTSIAMTRAALSWELSGPPRTVKQVQAMLNASEFNQGWQNMMMQVNIDLLTLDNGGFIEVIRDTPPRGRKPESMPVKGLAHLSGLSCIRTGNPETPVIYVDANGAQHPLKWYQVIMLTEAPMPESRTGRQLSFVSRVLGFADIIKSMIVHYEEKLSGRFTKAIHVVSGVAQGEIEKTQRMGQIDADNAGLMRYGQPLILTTLDPNARVTKETIELATLPDGFDMDQIMNWYITLLALASGSDYQEFAPLSNGNLGTASQSDTLHRKAQRKGTQLFIKLIETALHQNNVIPSNIQFRYKQQDAAAELEQAEIEKTRAETRKLQIDSGELTPEVARQIAVDKGDLKQEYLLALGEQDVTPDVTVSDDETVAEGMLALETGQNVDPRVAVETAKWWTKQVQMHPLQAVSPIDSDLLAHFTKALANEITTGTLDTNDDWMSYPLVKAAQESGIHPHMLRHRLPDNTTTIIGTSYATTKNAVITKTSQSKAVKQNPLTNLIVEFEKAWLETPVKSYLIRDYIIKAHKLRYGNEITPARFETLKKTIQTKITLLQHTNDVKLFALGLYDIYYS